MIAPRDSKELMKLMLRDPELRTEMHMVVDRADRQIRAEQLATLRKFLQRQQADVRMMDRGAIKKAMTGFYKKISLVGEFVKMY